MAKIKHAKNLNMKKSTAKISRSILQINCGCGHVAVIRGFFYNGISQLGNEQLAIIRNSEWPFLSGLEVYVSSIRTRACGCCSGVAVKRGSTVACRCR